MDSEKKRRIIKDYDATAHFYDERYSKIQQEKYEILLKNHLFKDKIILDAGSGTGLLLDFINEYDIQDDENKFILIGIDISLKMLEIFKLKLKNKMQSFQNNYHLVLCDLDNLPFRSNIFSSLLAMTSLQNLPNLENAINELHRVSKSNSEVKLSILKKKIKINELSKYIKKILFNPKITIKEEIEDVLIQGKLKPI